MNRLGLVPKLALVIGVGLLGVLAVAYLGSRQMTELLFQHAERALAGDLAAEGRRLAQRFEGDRAVVLALRQVPPVEGLIRAQRGGGLDRETGSTLTQWRERFETIFAAILRANPAYRQLRFLDAEGQEVVRVDSDGRRIRRVPPAELQSKKETEYVQRSLALPEGAVGISNITLNVEQGVIQRPYQPMVRLFTPVWVKRSGPSAEPRAGMTGLIVLNRDATGLLTTLKTAYGPAVRMTDEAGHFLAHPDPAALWGANLGHGATLARETPALWALAAAGGNRGSRYDPAREQVSLFAKVRYDPLDPARFWVLTVEVPAGAVLGDLLASRDRLFLLLAVVGAGLLGGVAWLGRRVTGRLAGLAAGTRAIAQGASAGGSRWAPRMKSACWRRRSTAWPRACSAISGGGRTPNAACGWSGGWPARWPKPPPRTRASPRRSGPFARRSAGTWARFGCRTGRPRRCGAGRSGIGAGGIWWSLRPSAGMLPFPRAEGCRGRSGSAAAPDGSPMWPRTRIFPGGRW